MYDIQHSINMKISVRLFIVIEKTIKESPASRKPKTHLINRHPRLNMTERQVSIIRRVALVSLSLVFGSQDLAIRNVRLKSFAKVVHAPEGVNYRQHQQDQS